MDFTAIFNGKALTLEEFNAATKTMKLADLSGGEYVAKGKFDELSGKLKTAQDDLSAAKGTITQLEAAKGDATALQKQIDEYKAADAKREADAKAATARTALLTRFDAVTKDKAFVHDYIKTGLFGDFEKALADSANAGKGDAEIFAALTKDKAGIFASQNPPPGMGGTGGVGNYTPGADDKLDDAAYYALHYTPKK